MTPRMSEAQEQTVSREKPLLDQIVEQQAQIASRYKPVLTIDEMIERDKAITYLVETRMREGIDYGWIPGTKPADSKPGEYQAKPTLFLAGAQLACAFFGYVPDFATEKEIEEWTNEKYGEPLFYYSYRCALRKDGHDVGQGLGSASTWESKYRYRNSDRLCPECGKGTIIKGKAEYGGGWLCFAKKGGCGAKFDDTDPAIVGQAIGKVPNADIADVVNTVQKMAQKRSYVAATLTATGLSSRFTQDLEDLTPTTETHEELVARRIAEEQAKSAKPSTQRRTATAPPAPQAAPWPEASATPQLIRGQAGASEKPLVTAPKAEAAEPVAVPEQDPQVVAMWKEMKGTRTSIALVFTRLQSALRQACANERVGDEHYFRILKTHGVTHQDQFAKLEQARACSRDLLLFVRELEQAPADGFQATDEDLPPILAGVGAGK